MLAKFWSGIKNRKNQPTLVVGKNAYGKFPDWANDLVIIIGGLYGLV